jgi:hypothetical protein
LDEAVAEQDQPGRGPLQGPALIIRYPSGKKTLPLLSTQRKKKGKIAYKKDDGSQGDVPLKKEEGKLGKAYKSIKNKLIRHNLNPDSGQLTLPSCHN